MNPCPSCGSDDYIVLDKHNTVLLVECAYCHVRWEIEER